MYYALRKNSKSLFKLGVDDRTQAVLYALKMGWMQMPTVKREDYQT